MMGRCNSLEFWYFCQRQLLETSYKLRIDSLDLIIHRPAETTNGTLSRSCACGFSLHRVPTCPKRTTHLQGTDGKRIRVGRGEQLRCHFVQHSGPDNREHNLEAEPRGYRGEFADGIRENWHGRNGRVAEFHDNYCQQYRVQPLGAPCWYQWGRARGRAASGRSHQKRPQQARAQRRVGTREIALLF